MQELDADTPARPGRRLKWVVGCSLVLLGILGLGAWSIASPDAVSYYAEPDEVVAGEVAADRAIRVGGVVAAGTLVRDGTSVSFAISDGSDSGDGVPVVYQGEVPDTLHEETDVVAEGKLDEDGTLVATRVIAKCSSKFETDDGDGVATGRSPGR